MDLYKPLHQPDKEWEILSLHLAHIKKGYFHSRFYKDERREISFDYINFIRSVQNFTQEEIQETVYEIELGDVRLLFEEYLDFIFMAVVEAGISVDTGLEAPMSKIVRLIFKNIAEIIDLDEVSSGSDINFELLDPMVYAINNFSSSPNSAFQYFPSGNQLTDFYVSSIIIIDTDGKPFLSRTYKDGIYDKDSLLLGMLFAALNQFADMIAALPITEIVLGCHRLFLQTVENLIIVTTIELKDSSIYINRNSVISQRIVKFNDILSRTIDNFVDTKLKTNELNINDPTLMMVVDALVLKSLQGTLGAKNIERGSLKDVDLFAQNEEQNS